MLLVSSSTATAPFADLEIRLPCPVSDDETRAVLDKSTGSLLLYFAVLLPGASDTDDRRNIEARPRRVRGQRSGPQKEAWRGEALYSPSPEKLESPSAILVLLHGLGDGPESYAMLGKRMALPETAVLSLQAPHQLPLGLDGRSWFEYFESDGDFIEPTAKECRRLRGLAATRGQLERLVEMLVAGGWNRRDIFLLGFSQGAITAIDLALHSKERFGGVVAVSGTVLSEENFAGVQCSRTPILATHGVNDDQERIGDARNKFARLQKALTSVGDTAPVQWKEFDKGHEMIRSESEMRVAMEFFAQHLDLRRDSPSEEDGEVYEVL